MYNIGDKVRWSTDEGSVVDSSVTKFVVKFGNGTTFTFLQTSGKLDGGNDVGVGDSVVLLSKGKVKKSIKLYQYQKISTTSTGQPFLKKTEGFYNDEHATKVLIPEGYTKVISSETLVEI